MSQRHHQLHTLSVHDYEGYGVYERDYGDLGALPSFDLTQLQNGVEVVGGLAHVPAALKPTAKQILDQMVFKEENERVYGARSGEASFVIGTPGNGWASKMVADGLVLMIDRGSIPSGLVEVMASDQPATVALYAGQPNKVGGAEWVIVGGPASLINSASLINQGQSPGTPPTTPTPSPGGGGGGGALPGGGAIPAGYPSGAPMIPGTHAPPCGSGEQEVYGLCFPMLNAPHAPPCSAEEDLINGACWPKPGGDVTPQPGGQPPSNGQPPATQTASMSTKFVVGALVGVAVVGAGVAIFAKKKPGGARRAMRANSIKMPKAFIG